MKKSTTKKEVPPQSLSRLIENLAGSVARGFERMDERLTRHDKDFVEVKENIKATRQTVLDMGDRFVPRYEFDNLLIRFNKLDQKVRGKWK